MQMETAGRKDILQKILREHLWRNVEELFSHECVHVRLKKKTPWKKKRIRPATSISSWKTELSMYFRGDHYCINNPTEWILVSDRTFRKTWKACYHKLRALKTLWKYLVLEWSERLNKCIRAITKTQEHVEAGVYFFTYMMGRQVVIYRKSCKVDRLENIEQWHFGCRIGNSSEAWHEYF